MSENSANASVPAFLLKLYKLVDDPDYDHVIGWDVDGKSFYVKDQATFAKDVLPIFFKHRNITSFIRQLNLYGFRKMQVVDLNAILYDDEALHFKHLYFMKDYQDLLEQIKRKGAGVKTDVVPHKGDVLHTVLGEVSHLQSRQDNMNGKLESMKRENEVLWRELTLMRQKHSKQQQIVNKLIQFLGSLLSGTRSAGMKRKKPLMIEGPSTHPAVPTKITRLSDIDHILPDYLVQSPPSEGQSLIPDITDDTLYNSYLSDLTTAESTDTLFDKNEISASGDMDPMTFSDVLSESIPNVSSLDTQTATPNEAMPTYDMSQMPNNRVALQRSNSVVELNDLVDTMDFSLSSLKDLLGDQYNVDRSTLQTLFNSDGTRNLTVESLLQDIPPWIDGMGDASTEGNELMEYTGNMLDLPDLVDNLPPSPTHELTLDTPSIDALLNAPFKDDDDFTPVTVSVDDID